MQNKLILLIFVVLTAGCYYDNEEELYGNECNTTDMSYAVDILPILETNCYVCHTASANQGGITIEGYTALSTYVDNGRFIGAITHSDGFSAMPQNAPMLSDCNIAKIQSWIDAGAPDN